MSNRPRLGREAVEKLLNTEQREKLAQLYELAHVLARSILGRDYKPTDELLETIRLSSYGSWLLAQNKRFDFPSREARLTCLLELFHLELLVDIDEMQPKAVAAAISEEMNSGRLRFPFMFGPELYLRAAELFPDERRVLNASDTRRLLENQPMGVFQSGRWLGGPWGLVDAGHDRRIGPSQDVPLQHCHDVSCWKVHPVRLSTDSGAEINKARHAIHVALESEGEDPSEFIPVLSELFKNPADEFDDENFGSIPFLIGDGLTHSDLKSLAHQLLNGPTAKQFRPAVQAMTARAGAKEEVTSGLDRAHLMQMVLLATNDEIAEALDALTFSTDTDAQILIPRGELRRSVLTNSKSSAFRNLPELSRLGVRVRSSMNVAPLRLRRLIKQIYLTPTSAEDIVRDAAEAESDETRDLEWQLRAIPGPSIEARLTEYLRKASPGEVLRRLILNTHDNVRIAAESLDLKFSDVSDDDLVERMLWKLGFDVGEGDELHENFWRHSERLRRAAETASVSSSVGEEEMREISGSYFPSLEGLLNDSLAYAVWALTTDHVSESDPYRYVYDDKAVALTSERLGEDLHAAGDIPSPKTGLEKWTLQPLCRGFAVLSDLLVKIEASKEDHIRVESSLPEFDSWTSIQRFPFRYTVSYLDLTEESRSKLHSVLRDTSRALIDSGVLELRNSLLHYRRSNVDLDGLVQALGKVESAVRQLESVGLVRILFHRQRVETDRWNRSLHVLRDGMSRELAISRPSAFAWLNLPDLDVPQYLMTIAQFDELGEYLRFRPGADSEYREMWSDLPQRRSESVDGSMETAGQGPSSSPQTTAT